MAVEDVQSRINNFWSIQSSVLMLVATLLAAITLTYIQSLFYSRSSEANRGQEPPIPPYCVPYLQHLLSFLSNPSKTFRTYNAMYGGRPFTLLMMNTKFHVFHEPSTCNYVFSRSRVFVFEPVLASMMENGMVCQKG